MSIDVEAWTDEESVHLTASLVVRDGHTMKGSLSQAELRAILEMARDLQVPRLEIAKRIGWKPNRLWQWAKRHDCAYLESEYHNAPLAWCTSRFNRDRPMGVHSIPELRRG